MKQIEYYQAADGRVPYLEWFDSLRDLKTQQRIDARLAHVRAGNLGVCRSVGKGVTELKLDFGPGYRIYIGQKGTELVFFSVTEIRAHNRETLSLRVAIGRIIGNDMAKKQRNYREDLLERLKDTNYAAGYLEAVLEEDGSPEAFLIALRDVAEARGMTQLARDTDLKRESLYTMLSKRGNPVLSSIYAILDALDMRLSIERKQPA